VTATPAQDVRALLDRLEQAHAAATPGPWCEDEEGFHDLEAIDEHGFGEVIGRIDAGEDVTLIVAAVNALPSLVSALRAVADLADELEDEADTALEKYPSNPFDVPIVRDIRAAAGSQKFTATRIRDALAAALSPTEVRP
jgi:hypothetical protein